MILRDKEGGGVLMTTTTRLTCRTTLQNTVESTHDGYSLLSLALICL